MARADKPGSDMSGSNKPDSEAPKLNFPVITPLRLWVRLEMSCIRLY